MANPMSSYGGNPSAYAQGNPSAYPQNRSQPSTPSHQQENAYNRRTGNYGYSPQPSFGFSQPHDPFAPPMVEGCFRCGLLDHLAAVCHARAQCTRCGHNHLERYHDQLEYLRARGGGRGRGGRTGGRGPQPPNTSNPV